MCSGRNPSSRLQSVALGSSQTFESVPPKGEPTCPPAPAVRQPCRKLCPFAPRAAAPCPVSCLVSPREQLYPLEFHCLTRPPKKPAERQSAALFAVCFFSF